MLDLFSKSIFTIAINLLLLIMIMLVDRKLSRIFLGHHDQIFSIKGVKNLIAEILKILIKNRAVSGERISLYRWLPSLIFILSALPFAIIPYSSPVYWEMIKIYPEAVRQDFGIFFIFLIFPLITFAVLLISRGSSSKFSMFGAIKLCVSNTTFNLSVALSVITMMYIFGTVDIHQIIQMQTGRFFGIIPYWGVLWQPFAAIIYLVGIFAHSTDLPFKAFGEGGQGHYYMDSSSVDHFLIRISHYFQMITLIMIFVIIFLGGYGLIPGLDSLVEQLPILLYFLQGLSFVIKIVAVYCVICILRFIVISLRTDQYVYVGWRIVFPLSLINFIMTVGVRCLGKM